MFIQNTTLFFTCATLVAVSFVKAAAQWPDSSIKAPIDFKAFYLSEGNTCNIEIVFKRDIQDGKYDYYTFGKFESGEQYLSQTVIQNDRNQPFAVVNATSTGQRGAYDLSNGYTLLPFKITTCYTGAKGTPKGFIIKAFKQGQDPLKATPFWTSDSFAVIDNHIVPMGGGVSSLAATHNGNTITVKWATQATDIAGFYVIVGQSGASKLYSKFVTDPSARSVDVVVDGDASSYQATVVLQDKEGAVVNPTSCAQVAVQ